MISETTIPSYSPGVRMREDPTRGGWVVLAPERLFMPDDHAVAVLELVDGIRTVRDIVDSLAVRYDAVRTVIAADVGAMLEDLAGKGAIRL